MTDTSLRVFLSYARSDAAAFAEELTYGLEAARFNAFLDKHDIAASEDWKNRLEALIRSADTVVFVITPGSLASEVCQWELDYALSQKKRIVPVVAADPDNQNIPETLSSLNYIFFNRDLSYGEALKDLANSLRVDIDWIREHTDLADRARGWKSNSEDVNRLLRGNELTKAAKWLDSWSAPAPEPTRLHHEFITRSLGQAEVEKIAAQKDSAWTFNVLLLAPLALALASVVVYLVNLMRLYRTQDETHLTLFTEMMLLQGQMDNIAAAAIVVNLLLLAGAIRLRRYFSMRQFGFVFLAFVSVAVLSFFILDYLAIEVVNRANELDILAAEARFFVDPCAPELREVFNEYRPGEQAADLACPINGERLPVLNEWRVEMFPFWFAPMVGFFLIAIILLASREGLRRKKLSS